MRRFASFPLLAWSCLCCAIATLAANGHAQEARAIVKYRSDPPATASMAHAQAALGTAEKMTQRLQGLSLHTGLTLKSGRHLSEHSQVVMTSGMTSAQLARQLARQPDVEYAEPDRRQKIAAAPNDPYYTSGPPIAGNTGGPTVGQWYLRAPTATAFSSINVEPAWDITTGSPGIVVAMLDTGVRFDHPDFLRASNGGNLLDGRDFITNTFVANDNSARDADASDPGDWVTSSDSQFCTDDPGGISVSNSSWHGTQTAGLVGAATQNGAGIAGIGRNVRILPIRVLGKCGGFASDIIAGARWAAGLAVPGEPSNPTPARVLNFSLGDSDTCLNSYADAFKDINAAGAVIVASAGNSDGHPVGNPANCEGAIAVAGLRHLGTKVGFSDMGPQIAISAPAGNCATSLSSQPCQYPIMTTSNAGTTTPVDGAAGGIYTSSFNHITVGTSFASPLVAGTVALMLSANPSLQPADVKLLLQAGARAFPTSGSDTPDISQCTAPNTLISQTECYCTTTTCGAGILDAGNAVALAVKAFLPRIEANPGSPQAGQTITLSSTSSLVPAGRSIAHYKWSVVNHGGIVSNFSSGADTATSQITPAAAGQFTVQLTLTDDLNQTASRTLTITVSALPSSGGGGALEPGFLLGLLAAVALLRWQGLRHSSTNQPSSSTP